MSSNRFTGSVPSEIGGLSMLTELHLHDNNFGGMFGLALIDRLYIWMTSVTELIYLFFIFFIASDGTFQLEVQNVLSKAHKETKGPKQFRDKRKF
jgi:hypothetical protein